MKFMYPMITSIWKPWEAWRQLAKWFQATNNTTRLMFKDKLIIIQLIDGAFYVWIFIVNPRHTIWTIEALVTLGKNVMPPSLQQCKCKQII